MERGLCAVQEAVTLGGLDLEREWVTSSALQPASLASNFCSFWQIKERFGSTVLASALFRSKSSRFHGGISAASGSLPVFKMGAAGETVILVLGFAWKRKETFSLIFH